MIRHFLILVMIPIPTLADVLVPVRTISAETVIGPEDIVLRDLDILGALVDPQDVVGMEARVALFAGRPIRLADLAPPAVVRRNDVVPLIYEAAGLSIKTEGRALDRASPGDQIRVMNLTSRSTVSATVDEFGIAHVSN